MNPVDALVRIAVETVTFLFLVGLIGSAGVVVLSFVEDLTELFGE